MFWMYMTTFPGAYNVKLNNNIDPHLKTKPELWLEKYFNSKGQIKTAQLKFWMNAAEV